MRYRLQLCKRRWSSLVTAMAKPSLNEGTWPLMGLELLRLLGYFRLIIGYQLLLVVNRCMGQVDQAEMLLYTAQLTLAVHMLRVRPGRKWWTGGLAAPLARPQT